jgi:protease-4
MGNMAASGGYYISMGASEIFAEPGTLTGSIGVVGGKFVLTGLLEGHLGITHDTLSRGRNAGLFSPWTPFSETQREAVHAMMADVYDAFTSKAAESRGLSADDIEAAAQGRLWTGRQALERGLVDRLGGLTEALARAEELAELRPEEADDLEIVEFPPPMNIIEWFMDEMTGGAQAALPTALGSVLSAEDLDALSQVHLWQSVLERERILAIPPVLLSVR